MDLGKEKQVDVYLKKIADALRETARRENTSEQDLLVDYLHSNYDKLDDAVKKYPQAVLFYIIAQHLGIPSIQLKRVVTPRRDKGHLWVVRNLTGNGDAGVEVWDPQLSLKGVPVEKAYEVFYQQLESIPNILNTNEVMPKTSNVQRAKKEKTPPQQSPEKPSGKKAMIILDADPRVSNEGNIQSWELPQLFVDNTLRNTSTFAALARMGTKYSASADSHAKQLVSERVPHPNLMEDSGAAYIDKTGNVILHVVDVAGGEGVYVKDYTGPQHPGSRFARRLTYAGHHAAMNGSMPLYSGTQSESIHNTIADAAGTFNTSEIRNPKDAQQAATAFARITPQGIVEAFNIADCRTYVWSPSTSRLEQITKDHSYIQVAAEALVQDGKAKDLSNAYAQIDHDPNFEYRSAITRTLSDPAWRNNVNAPKIEVRSTQLRPGDIVIVCSDGITHDQATSDKMLRALQTAQARTADQVIKTLDGMRSADNSVALAYQWNG